MGRRKKPPFSLLLEDLDPRGAARGWTDGEPVLVRGGTPGARVLVAPQGRKRRVRKGLLLETLEPAPGAVPPRCSQFGLCGGCSLQELKLEEQRRLKQAMAEEIMAPLEGVRLLPMLGAEQAYGYRNKVELSYGRRRYLSKADLDRGLPFAGRFLGFHAPGRFDRVVDAPRCELISEPMNQLLQRARIALEDSQLEPWCVRNHEGFWRHLLLREGHHRQERLVVIITATPPPGMEVIAERELQQLADSMVEARGVLWALNDGVADVARADTQRVLRGQEHFTETLGESAFQLGPWSFFQTTTPGAEILYRAIQELAGEGERLLDLYCGVGSIGLFLAERFREILGVELSAAAIADAERNAALCGLQDRVRFIEGAVEAQLDALGSGDVVIVDPPRAGLHPKAASWLARCEAARLIYVACKPGSLARDRPLLEEGGWRMDCLQAVDLFPQTPHLELIARFQRPQIPLSESTTSTRSPSS